MHRKLALASLTFVVLCLGSSAIAQADTVTFTDRAAFVVSSTNLTNIGFEGIAPAGGFVSFGSPGSLTLSGVTFTTPNFLFVQNRNSFGTGAFLTAQQGLPPGRLNVSLPAGITAVGTNYFAGNPVTVTLSTGEVFTVSGLSFPNLGFAGFTSDVAISSLQFSAGEGIDIDNFVFGQRAAVNPIPEPTTVLLLGTGLVGIGTAIRRRRNDRDTTNNIRTRP